MGIKISSGPKLVTRKIAIKEPINGTEYTTHRIMVTFDVIPRSEAEQVTKEDGAPLMERVLKGWGDPLNDGKGGFEDENGKALEFTPENLTAVNNVPWINAALIKAYFEVCYGGAKLGN